MDGSDSTDANPTHEFTSTGSYLMTLTVTDNDGMQSSSAIKISAKKGGRK